VHQLQAREGARYDLDGRSQLGIESARSVDVYRFPAFRPRAAVGCSAIPGPASCGLSGGEKTVRVVCGQASRRIYDRKLRWVRDLSAGDTRIYLQIESRRVRCRSCTKVKQENLVWFSDNPFYTKRF
jgi:hypothetical protein